MEMTYVNDEDHLVRALEVATIFDDNGCREGIKQFIDEKLFTPGLETHDVNRRMCARGIVHQLVQLTIDTSDCRTGCSVRLPACPIALVLNAGTDNDRQALLFPLARDLVRINLTPRQPTVCVPRQQAIVLVLAVPARMPAC